MPYFVEIARTAAEISQFFEFSRWRTPPCWIFKISNFYGRKGQEGWSAPVYQFRWNRLNCGRDMIFRFFKMAAAAILDFQNLKFLTSGKVKGVKLRNHDKFCRNRSNRGRDMWISILVWFENAYSSPFLRFFGGTFPPNDVTYRPNLQKDHFWAEPRHLIAMIGLSYTVTEI